MKYIKRFIVLLVYFLLFFFLMAITAAWSDTQSNKFIYFLVMTLPATAVALVFSLLFERLARNEALVTALCVWATSGVVFAWFKLRGMPGSLEIAYLWGLTTMLCVYLIVKAISRNVRDKYAA